MAPDFVSATMDGVRDNALHCVDCSQSTFKSRRPQKQKHEPFGSCFLFWCGLVQALRLFRFALENAPRFPFTPLTVTETCLTAIVKSLISIACNGRFRPRHKLCLCVCIRKLQVFVSAQIKKTRAIRFVFFCFGAVTET